MASIHGISAKNVKKFKGHEGEPLCQGTLYLGNKKIGFWAQDFSGGSDNITLDPLYSEKRLNEAVAKLNSEKAFHGGTADDPFVLEYNLERLMVDFISLTYDEKMYKNAVKKGFAGVLIATDGYHADGWSLPKKYTEMSDEALFKALEKEIAEAKESFFEEDEVMKHTVKVYRSLDDFNVGEPIRVSEILR